MDGFCSDTIAVNKHNRKSFSGLPWSVLEPQNKHHNCLASDLYQFSGPGYSGVRVRSRLTCVRPSPSYPSRMEMVYKF